MELSQQLAEQYLNSPKRLKNRNKIRLQGEFKIIGEDLVSDEYGDIFYGI